MATPEFVIRKKAPGGAERRRNLCSTTGATTGLIAGWKGGSIRGRQPAKNADRTSGPHQARPQNWTPSIALPPIAPTPARALEQQDRANRADELDQREQIQKREAEDLCHRPKHRSSAGTTLGIRFGADRGRRGARDGRKREADAVAQAARDAGKRAGRAVCSASPPRTTLAPMKPTSSANPHREARKRPASPTVGAGVRERTAQPKPFTRHARPEWRLLRQHHRWFRSSHAKAWRKADHIRQRRGDSHQPSSSQVGFVVERLDGIVTDQRGKPLAVIGGFKGANTQASVYPATLLVRPSAFRARLTSGSRNNHLERHANPFLRGPR